MAEKLGDEQRLARVYTYLINYHYLKGEPDLAIEYGERCLRHRRGGAATSALQSLARGYMGYSYHAQGQYRRAARDPARERRGARAGARRDAGRQAGVSYVSSSGWLAFTLAELGEFDAAALSLDKAQRGGRGERPRLHPGHRADDGRAGLAAPRAARARAARAASGASTPAATRASTCGGRFPRRCWASRSCCSAGARKACALLEDGVR